MITLKPGDEAKATDAIEHLVNRGRKQAMYQLMGTGIKISQAAQAITASQLSGPIKGAPRVRQVGDDEVHVGYSSSREAAHTEGAGEGAHRGETSGAEVG